MNSPSDRNVLLCALLERLGTTQARALLARLDQWLTHAGEKVQTQNLKFDRDQVLALQVPYDRRRHGGNETHRQTAKDSVLDLQGPQS